MCVYARDRRSLSLFRCAYPPPAHLLRSPSGARRRDLTKFKGLIREASMIMPRIGNYIWISIPIPALSVRGRAARGVSIVPAFKTSRAYPNVKKL